MEYIDHIEVNGTRGDIAVNKSGVGAPTESTVGNVGQFYMDSATEKVYKCTEAKNGKYTWKPIGGEDSGVTVIKNQDSTNKKPLRSIDSGTYVLSGYFTPYEGSTESYTFDSGMIVAVLKETSKSYIQVFYPKSNVIQYLEITDSAVTRKDAKLVNMESVANRVSSITSSSDATHYPSAKAVYEAIQASGVPLTGSTAPTTTTKGVVGQSYFVIVNKAVTDMYVCTSALIGSYTWDKVEFGSTYTLPEASSTELGGIKADSAQSTDTQAVRKGTDGKLYTAPGTVTDAQVSTAVSSWLTEHPEATTTVADGSVTPKKTSFFEQETESIYDVFARKANNMYAIKNDGTYYLHSWNKNTNMVADASDYDKIIVSAVASYINYLWFAEEPTNANGQTVLGYGGTYNGYTNLNNTDANEPTEHTVTISRPEGAVYLIIDFGYTTPADLQIAIPIEKYRFTNAVDKTVTTTDLADGAVTGNKIAGNSVSGDKLANSSIQADKLNGYEVWRREAKWEVFLDNYNTKTSSVYEDVNSAIYAIKLEAGKSYFMCYAPYVTNTNQFVGEPTYTDNSHPGYYLFYTSLPDVAQLQLEGENVLSGFYASGIFASGYLESITNGYMSTSSTYAQTSAASKYFTLTRDIFILRASLKPTDGKMITNARFYEVAGGIVSNAGNANNPIQLATVYYKELGNSYPNNVYYGDSLLAAPLATPRNEREYFAMSRDIPRDRSLYIQFIGDSITYAASNAGLSNAFRKYVPMDLCAPTKCLCQSGISVATNGGSYDWKGKLTTAEDYDATMTGYSGLATVLAKSDNNPNATEYEFSTYLWRQNVDIVVVALGTNDHWENSPLGSVSTLTDDTTFYGAVEKTLTLLENTYPNAHILWLLPFKNSKWNANNDAGCTMLDYLIALKILCQTHERVWTLDLFDKWYLDYDNESLRSKFFIDAVHITGDAHKCVAEAMVDKIRQIVSIKGLRRIQTVNITDNGDKVYGATTTTQQE